MVRRLAASLPVVVVLAVAAQAEVKGGPNPPAFTIEERVLIDRDPRLVAAAREHPWHLRCALDAWNETRRSGKPEPCPQLPPEPGRASTEGPFDLLQILREAGGGGPKR